jgi:hypothetical protein
MLENFENNRKNNMKKAEAISEKQLQRIRSVCTALPGVNEKLSHGEPTFFVQKKVFAMFANNHHDDGHVAVWLPVPLGVQELLVEGSPDTFFRPPYVGARGWVGIELSYISDAALTSYLQEAWTIIAPKRLREQVEATKTTVLQKKRDKHG